MINIFRLFIIIIFYILPPKLKSPTYPCKRSCYISDKSQIQRCVMFSLFTSSICGFFRTTVLYFFSMVWASPIYDELNKLHMFLLLPLAHFSRFSLHLIVFITLVGPHNQRFDKFWIIEFVWNLVILFYWNFFVKNIIDKNKS